MAWEQQYVPAEVMDVSSAHAGSSSGSDAEADIRRKSSWHVAKIAGMTLGSLGLLIAAAVVANHAFTRPRIPGINRERLVAFNDRSVQKGLLERSQQQKFAADRALDDSMGKKGGIFGGGDTQDEKARFLEVMAKKFVVIVDDSKLCKGLGPGFPLPVEITPFCHMHTLRTIAALPSVAGCEAVLRMGSSSTNKPDGDEIAVTDNGNYIVDLHFKEPIKDVNKAAEELKNTVGVVDHGLFVDMSYQVIIAGKDGIRVAEIGRAHV